MSNQRRIEIQRAGIDVHENRRRARPHNGAGRGKKAECGGNDRIPGLDAGGDQRQPEGLRAGRATNRASRSRQRGNLTLERLDFGTKNKALRIAHTRDGGQHVFADALVLAPQVKEWNGERTGASNGLWRGVSCRLLWRRSWCRSWWRSWR